jgi:hypothetical protein
MSDKTAFEVAAQQTMGATVQELNQRYMYLNMRGLPANATPISGDKTTIMKNQ